MNKIVKRVIDKWDWLVYKWDWLVYKWALKSFRRMAKTKPHYMYFISLWLAEWMKDAKMEEPLKSSARIFFESLRK